MVPDRAGQPDQQEIENRLGRSTLAGVDPDVSPAGQVGQVVKQGPVEAYRPGDRKGTDRTAVQNRQAVQLAGGQVPYAAPVQFLQKLLQFLPGLLPLMSELG